MSRDIHGRPTWAEVDLQALRWNVRQVRRLTGPDCGMLAVVKANAYGHGAVACAKVLKQSGVEALGVASVEEGLELRQAGVRGPVIVFGICQSDETANLVRAGLQPTVVDFKQAVSLDRAASREKKRIDIHVKVDTGMGRIGVLPQHVPELAHALKFLANIRVRGVFTHFAHADGRDKRLLHSQMALFRKSLDVFRQAGHGQLWAHAANSAAVMESPQTHLDFVRPGLMLYGVYPSSRLRKKALLKPVLSWKSRIIQLKTVPAKTGISYGHTFVTRKPTMIATLPVGYADGYSRGFSNQGVVLVRGTLCPIVGRVCMDMSLVDVSRVRGVRNGDDVVLLGKQGGREITADDLAEKIGTISYEILCAIGSRVPRLVRGT